MHRTGEIASTAAAPAAIGRYFHGVNNEDWDDFRGIWHDDAVVEVVGGIRVQGWDAILPYYVGALQNFPVHYDDPYRVHVAGDTVTVEIAFTGETVDGVPTTFEAVDVFTLEDGLVRRLTTWYDLDRVLSFTRTPGTPERRLRTLVRHAAAASPFYRRRFEELGLDADAVAAELDAAARDAARRDRGRRPRGGVAAPDHARVRTRRGGRAARPRRPGGARPDLGRGARTGGGRTRRHRLRSRPVAGARGGRGTGQGPARLRNRPRRRRGHCSHLPGRSAGGRARRGMRAPLWCSTIPRRASSRRPAAPAPCMRTRAHTSSRSSDGELVLTPLGARARPLLRWASGIEARWLDEPCPCGSDLPALELPGAPDG